MYKIIQNKIDNSIIKYNDTMNQIQSHVMLNS